MVPVVLSDGFTSDSLPPGKDAAQTAETALLGGWYISHIMAMLVVPLVVYGFLSIYQSVRDQSENQVAERVTLAGFFVLTMGGLLYLVAAGMDGIALGRAAEVFEASSGSEKEIAGMIVMATTETAASYGAHYMVFSMIGTGILALGLYVARRGSIQPILGVLVGVIGLLGWVTGFFDLTFQKRLPALTGVLGLVLLWWISLGIREIRHAKTEAQQSAPAEAKTA